MTVKQLRPYASLGAGLLDAALGETALDAQGHIGRQHVRELLNVLAVDGVLALEAEVRAEESLLNAKERLSGLLDAGVFVCEAGDEDCRLAVRVELGVQRTSGEDGHLELVQRVLDERGSVLLDEVCPERALDYDVDFGGTRVGVRSVEAAGADEADGHTDAGTDKGREELAVRLHSVPAIAFGDA